MEEHATSSLVSAVVDVMVIVLIIQSAASSYASRTVVDYFVS